MAKLSKSTLQWLDLILFQRLMALYKCDKSIFAKFSIVEIRFVVLVVVQLFVLGRLQDVGFVDIL